MDYLEYKGSIEYRKKDNCLCGKVQVMGNKALILYEGATIDKLRKDFEDGIEPVKPFSGKLNLRMSPDLYARVAAFSASTGITINDLINRAIANELDHECIM